MSEKSFKEIVYCEILKHIIDKLPNKWEEIEISWPNNVHWVNTQCDCGETFIYYPALADNGIRHDESIRIIDFHHDHVDININSPNMIEQISECLKCRCAIEASWNKE